MNKPNKPKIYIDGQAGTTGLQIVERLQEREDLILLLLDDDRRHDLQARKAMMEQADLVFLCLPDAAAIEAAALCPETTKLIDTSTAHRTTWTYGFAELNASQKEKIQNTRRVANPGCHATGAIALLAPLVQSGWLPADAFLSIFSLTGYNGGGKKMITQYENDPAACLAAPGAYGRTLSHKHIPEIMKYASLSRKPAFLPVVDDYPQGMMTSIMIDADQFGVPVTASQIRELYQTWYEGSQTISIIEQEGTLYAGSKAGFDDLAIEVSGNDGQILLQAVFDNLGKGASGAAVQNMNLMLGLEEEAGLHLQTEDQKQKQIEK